MEEKIVENKKEGSSFSSSLSLPSLSHLSHQSIYLVCLRSTTPLWFTDTYGPEKIIGKKKNVKCPSLMHLLCMHVSHYLLIALFIEI